MDGMGDPNQSIRTRRRVEKSTFILTASMPLPQYMFMGQYIRKQKDEAPKQGQKCGSPYGPLADKKT